MSAYPAPDEDRLTHRIAQAINPHVDSWKRAGWLATAVTGDVDVQRELDRSPSAVRAAALNEAARLAREWGAEFPSCNAAQEIAARLEAAAGRALAPQPEAAPGQCTNPMCIPCDTQRAFPQAAYRCPSTAPDAE